MQLTLKSSNKEAKIGQLGSPLVNPNITILSNTRVIYSSMLPTIVVCSNQNVKIKLKLSTDVFITYCYMLME